MILTISEFFDIIFMSLIIGFIFSDVFVRETYSRFNIKSILIAASITAPAIILHEFSHKFVAIYFNLSATFHAAYGWLILGIILKILNTGFIFFVPAYVSIVGTGTNLNYALISLAGPLMNGFLWFICFILLNTRVAKKYVIFLSFTKRINGFLFVFNMLPIPGFDGFSFYYNVWKIIF